jgi:hypothetical protein
VCCVGSGLRRIDHLFVVCCVGSGLHRIDHLFRGVLPCVCV